MCTCTYIFTFMRKLAYCTLYNQLPDEYLHNNLARVKAYKMWYKIDVLYTVKDGCQTCRKYVPTFLHPWTQNYVRVRTDKKKYKNLRPVIKFAFRMLKVQNKCIKHKNNKINVYEVSCWCENFFVVWQMIKILLMIGWWTKSFS